MEINELSYAAIGSAIRGGNELGPGLREKPYKKALTFDRLEQRLPFVRQSASLILSWEAGWWLKRSRSKREASVDSFCTDKVRVKAMKTDQGSS